jgi:hypothetical protein
LTKGKGKGKGNKHKDDREVNGYDVYIDRYN